MILRLNSVNCLVMKRLEEAFNNVTNFIETSHTYRFGMNELRKKMEMIRTEIQEMKAENQSYSPPTKFLDSVSTSIPPLLQNFLSKLVYSDKSNEEDQNSVKLDTIAHSIISMIRPKSFISNLQLAIATYVHRKTGSKLIIDLLSKLGICATYYSLQLFEASTIKNLPEVIIDDDTFVQFVFDNTDHNVDTLDGQETFHCLGGIAAYCPKENISYQGGSKKLKKMPTAHEIASLKQIEIVPYQCPDISRMKDITFVN
ncbi:GSCOCG00012775001-RA-CDS, partial [Cotesia congregata]